MEATHVVETEWRATSAHRAFPDAQQLEAVKDCETVSTCLGAAAVLPEQFTSPAASPQKMRGEVALMVAVLEDAIACFQKGARATGKRARRLAREAEEWLWSNDPRWPFSCVNICAVLGIEPGYMRLGLKRWRHHPPTKPPKRTRPIVLAQWRHQIAA
jgi:hypothetical protein